MLQLNSSLVCPLVSKQNTTPGKDDATNNPTKFAPVNKPKKNFIQTLFIYIQLLTKHNEYNFPIFYRKCYYIFEPVFEYEGSIWDISKKQFLRRNRMKFLLMVIVFSYLQYFLRQLIIKFKLRSKMQLFYLHSLVAMGYTHWEPNWDNTRAWADMW